jgi:hypothetical protein
MTSQRRTALIMTSIWAVLAFCQYARTAVLCLGVDRSPISLLLWAGQLALLTMPLVLVWRKNRVALGAANDGDLALILLGYVPATLALHIAETCARH